MSFQGYVPRLAYVERLTDEELVAVRADELVRAVVPFVAAFKLDPDIGRRSSSPRSVARLARSCWSWLPGRTVEELQAALERLDLRVVVQRRGGGRHHSLHREAGRSRPRGRDRRDRRRQVRRGDRRRHAQQRHDELGRSEQCRQCPSAVGSRAARRGTGHRPSRRRARSRPLLLRGRHRQHAPPAHRKVVGVHNVANGTVSSAHGTFSAGNAAGKIATPTPCRRRPTPTTATRHGQLSHAYLIDLDFIPGGTVTFLDYLTRMASDGAHIHTNSWDDKSTSNYTQLSVDADRFTWDNEDQLVIIGPDNNGTIRPPDSARTRSSSTQPSRTRTRATSRRGS